MNKRYKMLGIFSTFITLSGCASFTSPARMHELDAGKPYWFDYDATRRGAILFPSNPSSTVTICAEPSPDVALDIVNKLKLEAEAEKIQTKGKFESEISEQVVQLAKRTQTIMFLRESLYRLCELSGNRNLKNEDVIAQYKSVIDAASKLAEAELENSKQGALEAETNLLKLQQIQKSTGSAIDNATKKNREQ